MNKIEEEDKFSRYTWWGAAGGALVGLGYGFARWDAGILAPIGYAFVGALVGGLLGLSIVSKFIWLIVAAVLVGIGLAFLK